MNKSTSPHILNTSANLLGFTFIVLSSIKSLGLAQGTSVNKVISFCIVLFALSSFLSFASMHTKSEERTIRYEFAAEYVFLGGLFIVSIVAILFAFDIILLGK